MNIKNEKIKYMLSGLSTVLVLLWSNDYAISSAGLFVLFLAGYTLYNKTFNLKNALIYLFSLAISFVLIFSLITYGHVLSVMRYNFVDVAQDQFWYFGGYSEWHRILNLQQLYKLFYYENLFPRIVLALMALLAIKTKQIEHVIVFWIGLALFSGGAVASIGGHVGGYFEAFYFWGSVTLIIVMARLAWSSVNSVVHQKLPMQKIANLSAYILVFTFFLVSAVVTFNVWNNWQSSLSKAKTDPNLFYVSELGGYLGNDWKDYITLIRQTDSNKVIEEYWGLWSATKKIVSLWPVDSVISALGSTRDVATHKMQDADIIISTRYMTSPEWQPWSVSQNYWFYGKLMEGWTPQALSPTTVIWRKNNGHSVYKKTNCIADEQNRLLILDAPIAGFYEIAMDYSFHGSGRFIVMIKNNLSFGGDAGGYVSINPKGDIAKLPVYIAQTGWNKLDIKIIGTENYDLKLLGCDAHQITFTNPNVLHVPPAFNERFFVTDGYWNNGIARYWAGFFVPNTDEFSSIYKPNRLVRFPDGNTRKILRTEINAEYLNVYIEGMPLDREKVGYPTTFVVVDDISQNLGDKK